MQSVILGVCFLSFCVIFQGLSYLLAIAHLVSWTTS